jgi:MoxR-like ATPase
MTNLPKLENFLPLDFKVSNPDPKRKLNHIFNKEDCYALWAAYAAGRPLLVRGKPGTGKSQMARAIAEQLGWAFVSEVVRGSTELSDLHWHFDAIGRLGEAQARAGENKDTKQPDPLNPLNFLAPGAFWWAFNWQTAHDQFKKCPAHLRPMPKKPDENWNPQTGGVVLLLDEIDKAEPDLPNGLLETLGLYEFTVPYLDHAEQDTASINPIKADPSRLLVIITTNEDRELPKAFVRRCFVHTLKMEESAEKLEPLDEKSLEKRHDWLMQRGRLHFGKQIAEPVYLKAAELLWDDRSASPHGQYPPGLAEYIDLLNAIKSLEHQEQLIRLEVIRNYALKKDQEP